MYELILEERVRKKFNKLAKKDKKQAESISKTIKKILKTPLSSKPLKKPMQGLRREHVNSFVIIFSINKKEKKVIIEAYKHVQLTKLIDVSTNRRLVADHDEVYKSS